MSTKWRPTTKYVVGFSLVVIFFALLYISRSVLYLLIIGALIAFLIKPMIDYFVGRLRLPKGLSVFFAHFVAAIFILIAPLILIPTIVNAGNFLLNLDYQLILNNVLQWFETTLLHIKESGLQFFGYKLVLDSVVDPILNSINNVDPVIKPELPSYPIILDSITSAFTVSYGIAVSVVGTVFSAVVSLFFIFISSIYLSSDSVRFYSSIVNLIPAPYRPEINLLVDRLNFVWRSFLRGQFILMLLIGFIVWIGGTVIGLEGAFALGVIAGFLEIIPNIGPTLAVIPAILVALIQGSSILPVNNVTFVVIVVAFYILVQGLENYLIVPRVLGDAVKIHPFVVIFGVFVGVSVGGVLGALLAAPVIASCKEVLSYLLRKILDEDPFPPQESVQIEDGSPLEILGKLKTKWQSIVKKKNVSEKIQEETSHTEEE